MSSWFLLIMAGAVEVVMALALKRSESWTRPVPSALGIAAALASIFLLTLALKRIPVATGYVVWTGIGAAGVTLAGVLLFGESLSAQRAVCIGLIVAGTVGLRLLET
jgi:quaternary ammonium compound-resistance protein SugE